MDEQLSRQDTLPQGLTFNDVLLLPGYIDFPLSEVGLSAQLTRNISLDIPLVSAPMDTVTEHGLAIALAREGGIGIIHRNLTPDDQASEVAKVKHEGMLVGAAIGTRPGYQERVGMLVDASVDVLVIDTAHGYSKFVIGALTYLKKHYPELDVIAGNIATAEAAEALIEAGADGLRVGMGPGAICTTRLVTGMGVPQFTAIRDVSRVAREHSVPVIADGGIDRSGDITKALGAGASSVMLGRLFAATKESCAITQDLPIEQVPDRFKSIITTTDTTYCFKAYRGMGSVGAMAQGKAVSAEDEFHGNDYTKEGVLVPEGVEGLVPCSGPLATFVRMYMGGVKRGIQDAGARTIPELHQRARFIQITTASLSESHPHHILVT